MSYSPGGPTGQVFAVTPSDSAPVRGGNPKALVFDWLRVDVAGTIRIEKPDETVVNLTALAGEYIPIRGTHVHSTGTAATGIIAAFPEVLYVG